MCPIYDKKDAVCFQVRGPSVIPPVPFLIQIKVEASMLKFWFEIVCVYINLILRIHFHYEINHLICMPNFLIAEYLG